MSDIVIVAAARTAVGKFGGSLAKTPASELGAIVIQDLLRRSGSTEGPELMGELEALAGSTGAAKGLLVRLRHSPQVKIEVRDGVQVFTWVEE